MHRRTNITTVWNGIHDICQNKQKVLKKFSFVFGCIFRLKWFTDFAIIMWLKLSPAPCRHFKLYFPFHSNANQCLSAHIEFEAEIKKNMKPLVNCDSYYFVQSHLKICAYFKYLLSKEIFETSFTEKRANDNI